MIVFALWRRALIKLCRWPKVIKRFDVYQHECYSHLGKLFSTAKNKTSDLTMAMISVDGISYLVRKGETVASLRIQNIAADRLEIKENKN